ncbi:Josephin [Pseudovibrio denitrificans]|uniref:Josephin n=1 Tax=Pseudovibrio denitrificans TaxID=258256 RepID=A0A1I7AS77_9HYPH|nr:hypothetical protein [Pseudovibrio denitrificans]SFT77819.1 Josephin [Pseudovibrio denitrificans]
MAKGTLEVAEYQWAQKFYKHNSWPFDEYDGDPTPASIEAHCKNRSAQYKAELASYKALKHTLESDAQVQTFDSLCDQTQSRMKNADDLLQAGNFLDADSTLDDIAALVDGVGILVGKSRATEQQKNGADGQQNAESSTPHVDPLQALQQRATEFSAKLKGYKAERKILVSKDQKTLFDQLFKQAASTMTYITSLVKNGDAAGADQRLFDAEAQLQGVQQVLEMQKQTVRETESIKTAIKEANTRLSEADGLRKTIKSPQEQKAFADSSKQAKGQVKQIEGLLKRHELDACQAELKNLDNMVEKTESYVKFVPVDPSLSRELKTTRIEIQSCYQQVNEVPDKALKRDFEKNYQVAINLLAETEDLIEGHGRSSEETIAANLATLKNLTETLIDCVVNAKEAAEKQAANPTQGKRSSPDSATKNAAQNALNKALAGCMGSLDEAQANLNEVLKAGAEIKDPALASSFAQYSSAAQTYITEGLQYVADRKLQEARGKLATCEDAIKSMIAFLGTAHSTPENQEEASTDHQQESKVSEIELDTFQAGDDEQKAALADCKRLLDQLAVRQASAVAQNPQFQQEFQHDEFLTFKVISEEFESQIDALIASGNAADAKSRLQDFENVVQSLEDSVQNALSSAIQPEEEQGGQPEPDPVLEASLNTCQVQLQKLIGRYNKAMAGNPQLPDQSLQNTFLTYQMVWEQLSSQAEHLIQENRLKDAENRLSELESVVANIEDFAKQGAQPNEQSQPPEIAQVSKTREDYLKQYESLDASKSVFLRQELLIKDPELLAEFQTIKVLFEFAMPEAKRCINADQLDGLSIVMASLEEHRDQLNTILNRARVQNAEALAKRKQEQEAAKQARLDAAPAISFKDAEKLASKLSAMRKYVKDPTKLKIFDEQANFVRLSIAQLKKMAQTGQTSQMDEILKALGRAKAELQMLADENRQIQVKYSNRAPGIRNNVDARKKPSGENPQFFCEVQEGQFCLKHAINACLGFQATDKNDLLDASLVNHLKAYESKTDEEFLRYASGVLKRKVKTLRQEHQKDPKKLAREVATEEYKKLYKTDPLQDISNKGSIADVGLELLKAQQQKLGLPDPQITYIEHTKTPAEEDIARELLSHVVNSGEDRFVINIGGHYVAFRQVEEGDWYLVNSTSSAATKMDPVEYCLNHIKSSGTRLPVIHFEKQVAL